MSINTRISNHTLGLLDYDKFKLNVLESICKEYLPNEDFNNIRKEFNKIDTCNPSSLKKKKRKIVKKPINECEKCHAFIWKKGEKNQCNNKKSSGSKYCRIHSCNRFYGNININ